MLNVTKKNLKMQTQRLSKAIATRDRAFDYFNMGMFLPNPDPVLKAKNKDISIYRELLSDAHVWSCAQSRKAKVLSMSWDIDRGKAGARLEKEYRAIMDDLDMPRIIAEILNAPLFGYQPMEVMWNKGARTWWPNDVMSKPQEWIVFDETDNRPKFRTKGNFNGEPIPDRRILIPTYNATYQNPYGEAILARCFWPTTFKRGGMKYWITFAEKYGMPFPVGYYSGEKDDDEIDDLIEMLERLIQDAVAAVPDSDRVEFLDFQRTGSSEVYQDLTGAMNTEISKAILSQTLTTELGSVGSFAASETHSGIRDDTGEWDARIVSRTINELFQWIAYYNYGNVHVPIFDIWEDEGIDTTQAERDKILCDTGLVKPTRAYWIKTYGFEEDDLEKETEPEPQTAGGNPQTGLPAAESGLLVDQDDDEFAENKELDITAAFDRDIKPETVHNIGEQLLSPVIDVINNGGTFAEMMRDVNDLYPFMDASQLYELLAKAQFVVGAQAVVEGGNG